ncbi:MAG: GpE family phage tail protein [Salinisphaeraceae bacterium]
MADIAFIFHWQPDWLLSRGCSDILAWRDRALARWQAAYGERS